MLGCGRGAFLGTGGVDASPGHPEAAVFDGDPSACRNESADAAPSEAASSVQSIVVAGGAFNEPTNGGYASDINPSWLAHCFLRLAVRPPQRLRGHDVRRQRTERRRTQGRPVLVRDGLLPPLNHDLDGVLLQRLSGISGVVSSTRDDPPVFPLDVAFDLTVVPAGAGLGPLAEVDISLTWVRVYRKGSVFQYQVLPGTSRVAPPNLTFDRPATVSGFFDDYAPLADNPSLGGDFDYPTWIA